MRLGPPAVLLGVLALMVPASAGAVIRPELRLAMRSHIHTPQATVVHARCPWSSPDAASPVGCTDLDARTVYIVPGSDRFAREHELGHLFDAERLSPAGRALLQRLMGFPAALPWWNGTGEDGLDSPGERFADGYAACRLGLDPLTDWETGYGWDPSRRRFARFCRALRGL